MRDVKTLQHLKTCATLLAKAMTVLASVIIGSVIGGVVCGLIVLQFRQMELYNCVVIPIAAIIGGLVGHRCSTAKRYHTRVHILYKCLGIVTGIVLGAGIAIATTFITVTVLAMAVNEGYAHVGHMYLITTPPLGAILGAPLGYYYTAYRPKRSI